MLNTAYVITDLGPGDGGKGTIVHSLCQAVDAAIVIKRGGAQGSHGVRTSHGESFNFSQWGCGTLEGIPTYCSPQMIISPVGLINESDELKHHGIYNPFEMISVHPDCICSTPYHMISSQIEELLLRDHHRGTIGTGVGRSYRMYQQFGADMTIFASDLTSKPPLEAKLHRQIEYYRAKYSMVTAKDCNPEDHQIMSENLDLLYDKGLPDYTLSLFYIVGKQLRVDLFSRILQLDGTAVVECSHGVLTDAKEGFQPHVSAIRTLPVFTNNMLRDSGFDGNIINLGVHRAYEIRHGAGPMPTYDAKFTSAMLPGSHKDTNRWQGSVRAGPLDVEFLQCALSKSKDITFDGICLTWFDQILRANIWKISENHQKNPKLYDIPDTKHNTIFSFVDEIVMKYVGAPLKILSLGATEKDKIIKL